MQIPLGTVRQAVSFVSSLADLDHPDRFTEFVLPGLNQVVGSDVLTYNEVRAGVGVDWKIWSFLTLTGEVGYQPYRGFDYYRTDLRFHEDGSAPYGMIALHGAF